MQGKQPIKSDFLDSSLLGFTRLGCLLRRRGWQEADFNLSGRSVVVTGSTRGIGLAAAQAFAAKGARVAVVGRDLQRLARAQQTVGEGCLAFCADLSSLKAAQSLATEIRAQMPTLHVLVNNAGTLLPTHRLTSEGFETTWATNFLSHVVLTRGLLSCFDDPSLARIVNVSSGGMLAASLEVPNFRQGPEGYRGAKVYAQTKRAQVVWTELLAQELAPRGIVVHSMHPGWANTATVRRSLPWFYWLLYPFLRTPSQGADTCVWLGAAEQAAASTGGFWHDRALRPKHRMLRTQRSDSPEVRQEFSARLRETLAHGL